MKKTLVKSWLIFLIAILANNFSFSQTAATENPKPVVKLADVFNHMEDSLKKEFASKNISWPPKAIYVRSFKYDRQLEIWVKGNDSEPYRFLKTFKVCMQSGIIGPKRMEGDFQVPEGFYYINDFNPFSNYHLSLGLNYPNCSDRILSSDSLHPGSDIYIHGNCVSVGCIPINDEPIEELYVLASYARSNGQDFIPVHVFPVKYSEKKSMDFLGETLKGKADLQKFAMTLKEAFNYFEEKKQLPVVLVNKKGEYIID
jgi:murein L,D-transpeptidase YafK